MEEPLYRIKEWYNQCILLVISTACNMHDMNIKFPYYRFTQPNNKEMFIQHSGVVRQKEKFRQQSTAGNSECLKIGAETCISPGLVQPLLQGMKQAWEPAAHRYLHQWNLHSS
jgi:hypothetical protein